MQKKTPNVKRLQQILASIDRGDIYRSIYDPQGNLLARGDIPVKQQLVDDYCTVDFQGKTVIDLGCNFGFFSILAAKLGAQQITALDYLPEIVEGAGILASMYGHENITFKTFDIEAPKDDLGKFDIAMLVDFFGKSNIRKQKIKQLLTFLRTLSDSELLMAFRPINRIEKDLRMSLEDFSKLYPAQFITDGSFFLVDYVKDILKNDWEMTPISNYKGQFSKDKSLFHCRNKA